MSKPCIYCRAVPLSEVQDWLKTVPTVSLEPVKCGSISLDEPVVEAIEQAIQQTKVRYSSNTLDFNYNRILIVLKKYYDVLDVGQETLNLAVQPESKLAGMILSDKKSIAIQL